MPQHRETRLLSYSACQMYDLVAAIERYPEFLPWCKGMLILSRDKDGLVADMIVGTNFFQEKFTTHVTFDRPRAITVQYCSGPLSHLSNAWSFEPRGRKSCEVSFYVDFEFRSPLLRATMGVVFDKATRKMIAAFEDRAKTLYGDIQKLKKTRSKI